MVDRWVRIPHDHYLFNYTIPFKPANTGLLGAMSTHQFIQQNQDRIENIDGNLDDAAITIMGESGRLEFYYFENGVLVNAKAKNTNLVEW